MSVNKFNWPIFAEKRPFVSKNLLLAFLLLLEISCSHKLAEPTCHCSRHSKLDVPGKLLSSSLLKLEVKIRVGFLTSSA